jgi:hypothetical protein
MGPIGVSELGGAALRGGVDGAMTATDSDGSDRGGGDGGLLVRLGKKRKHRRERKCAVVPGQPFYTGAQRWGMNRRKAPRDVSKIQTVSKTFNFFKL